MGLKAIPIAGDVQRAAGNIDGAGGDATILRLEAVASGGNGYIAAGDREGTGGFYAVAGRIDVQLTAGDRETILGIEGVVAPGLYGEGTIPADGEGGLGAENRRGILICLQKAVQKDVQCMGGQGQGHVILGLDGETLRPLERDAGQDQLHFAVCIYDKLSGQLPGETVDTRLGDGHGASIGGEENALRREIRRGKIHRHNGRNGRDDGDLRGRCGIRCCGIGGAQKDRHRSQHRADNMF